MASDETEIMSENSTAASREFRFRGPHTFHFARKRYKLDGLRSRMAEHRTCCPGGGGHWSGHTGNGEAWHKNSDRVWCRVRRIKAGQWAGPWIHRRVEDYFNAEA